MIVPGLVMVLTLVGAIWAVSRPSIVHAIFGLGIALVGVALTFLLLGSPFLAAMEVLIYIGGITVAMAFGVMLSSAGRNEPGESAGRRILAALAATAFFVALVLIIRSTSFKEMAVPSPESWSVQAIGTQLLDHFNVVFEVLSVVLLVAIIGAITIASRRDDQRRDPTAPEENNP